jgi:hypothetical protein
VMGSELPRSMEMIEIERSIDQFSLIEAIELITAVIEIEIEIERVT